MDQEQLDKGKSLSKEIALTEEKLTDCQHALTSIENGTRGHGQLALKIPNVPGLSSTWSPGYTHVNVAIPDEQMVYALILAEKKIQKQLNQLTQEFDNL